MEDWELKVQPSKVLAMRKNEQGELEVLIQWEDMPEFGSSWELAKDIKLSSPSFHLEDKVIVQGGGIVRNQVSGVIKVYKQKRFRGTLGNQNDELRGDLGGLHSV